MTTTQPHHGNPHRTTPAPQGTEAGEWHQGTTPTYRVIYGTARTIPGRPDVTIQPTAIQHADGSIDAGEIEPPGVHVEVGTSPLTVDQARRLAAEVMAAADHLAALAAEMNFWEWGPKFCNLPNHLGSGPELGHPLDRVGLVEIVDHLTRRISGPGALRHALAATDPARLTPTDRDTMLELIQRSERLELEAMESRRAARGAASIDADREGQQ